MAEFRITRASVLRIPRCSPYFIQVLDSMAAQQGHGEPDLIFPDGWTEELSVEMYRKEPMAHRWLMARGLIPTDRVAELFPRDLKGAALLNYPLAKLPSEMTDEDWKRVGQIGHL